MLSKPLGSGMGEKGERKRGKKGEKKDFFKKKTMASKTKYTRLTPQSTTAAIVLDLT